MPTAPASRSPDVGPRRAGRRGGRVAPLYHQLYVLLRDQLLEGSLDPARALPSEPDLAARYGVSRVTIRRTLAALEREGLIRRVRGVGTYPARPPREGRANISGYLENLISFERRTEAANLACGTAKPTGAVAEALGPAPCLRVVRVRSFEGRPISLTTLHVPTLLAARIDAEADPAVPVIQLLEAAGVEAERSEQVVTAVAAGAPAVEALGVTPGAPLIAMRRLMLDAQGTPVLHQESLYAPERFEYRMTLTRTAVGPVARWTPTA